MLIFLTGIIASVAHVVTGPDHLAAVTPLAIDSRKKSWIIGFSWGLGHTAGILILGMLFLLFREFLPVDAIARHSDTLVGLLLIGIGTWALARIFLRHSHRNRPHVHFHTSPYLFFHWHRHTHQECSGHEHSHTVTVRHNAVTSFFIGIVHGFAGFSHLFALLPSLALPSGWDTGLYLVAFAIGTILSMMIFAFILGIIAFKSELKDKNQFLKWFTLGGGFLAIAIGILWLVHPV
jgi:ABC-type nickel/cobalt efflux system permease component RcnA